MTQSCITRFMALALLCCVVAATPLHASEALRLVVTTSVDNSGLTAHLLPHFEAQSKTPVRLLAVGTGRALALGRAGDVDVLMVHSEQDEKAFVASGHGLARHLVMRNDFVLLGPEDDPAGVADAKSVAEAFRALASHKALFVSRGDDSGTHKREKALWQNIGVDAQSLPGLRSVGQGMGRVLLISDQLGAYTLSDRGTWLAYRAKLHLKVLFEGGEGLNNPYGIIAVDPKQHPNVNAAAAKRFIGWITGAEGQRLIGEYKKHGQALFQPVAESQP